MKIILSLIALVVIAYIVLKVLVGSGVAKENQKIGAEFLEKNATEQDVQITSSGLQYKVLAQGEGAARPQATDRVTVHYHGTLIDGTVFDSSVDRGEPIAFALNQVIKGWTEGLQLMVVGEKTRFFIPSDLAYGNGSAGKIKGGSTLIFDVELLGIND
jgi:peptidylprolyl isomerase